MCEKPVAPAIERIDQWVASLGVESQRALDHSSNLIVVDRSGPTRANFVEQTIEPIFKKAPSPFANRIPISLAPMAASGTRPGQGRSS